MWNKLLIAVLAFAAATCADDGVDDNEGSLPTDESRPPPLINSAERQTALPHPAASPCGQLPADNSACAHACDPAVLVSYVPIGECASFTCKLRDGSYFMTGACNM